MMDERDWESAEGLQTYVDDLFEKMRLYFDSWLEYKFDKNKIEILKRSDIIKMAETSSAAKQMLAVRASYRSFVVVAYLLGNEEDFKESLQRLEDTTAKVATGRSVPPRPRFIERIFQNNAG